MVSIILFAISLNHQKIYILYETISNHKFFFLVKYKTALRRAIRKLKQYSLVHSKALQNTFPEMKCTHEMETSLKDNIWNMNSDYKH